MHINQYFGWYSMDFVKYYRGGWKKELVAWGKTLWRGCIRVEPPRMDDQKFD